MVKPIITHSIAVIAAVLAVLAWDHYKPTPQPVGEYTTAKVAPEVVGLPKVDVPLKKIKAFAPMDSDNLKLPEPLKKEPVIAATVCPTDPHPQIVVSVVDKDTGEVTTVTRVEPYPLLAALNSSSVSLGYGASRAGPLWELSARKDLFQVKGVNFGITARADTQREYRGMVLATYSFR